MKLYFNAVVVNWFLLLLLICEAIVLESFVLPYTTNLKHHHYRNESLSPRKINFEIRDHDGKQHLKSSTSFFMSSSKTSETSESISSDSESVTITTPQFYPNPKSPIHKNTYPSMLHKIHLISSFLSKTEASKCLQISQSYAQQSSCWDQKDSDRHSAYSTVDFPIEDCEELNDFLDTIDFDDRLWNMIAKKYDIDVDDLSFLDFFVVHYQAKQNVEDDTNNNSDDSFVMDSLDPHRDGSLISFTVVLSESDSYEGGGTIFDALRDVNTDDDIHGGMLCENGVVRVKSAGDAVLHSGKLMHGGNVVTKGERTVMVGFVDVNDRCMRDGVMKEACKEWGRCDVAENRLKRQQMKMKSLPSLGDNQIDDNNTTNSGSHSSSFTGRWKVKKDTKYINNIGGFVPAFSSVENRADVEKRRLRCMEAEDICLRDLLLPREERQSSGSIPDHILAQFGGDVTIL